VTPLLHEIKYSWIVDVYFPNFLWQTQEIEYYRLLHPMQLSFKRMLAKDIRPVKNKIHGFVVEYTGVVLPDLDWARAIFPSQEIKRLVHPVFQDTKQDLQVFLLTR
jgi:hypothetical protein